MAKSYVRQLGPAKDSVMRESVAARLMLERRLGQVLDRVLCKAATRKIQSHRG
jgi:hypothetical protein